MKKSVFIIIASVLAILLIAVWVYLLFFRVEGGDEPNFSDLNFEDTTDTTFEPAVTEPEPVVDVVNTERVRQLTSNPVVGYEEVTNGLGEVIVLYVEAGTGHIYEINLTSGEEQRISGTTFANIKKADLTPDGTNVMLETGSGVTKDFVLGKMSSSTGEFIFNSIQEEVVDFTSTNDNQFLFTTLIDGGGLVASRYNPANSTSEILFEIPFREAVVRWGHTATSSHYIYPKANSKLEGYLYRSLDGSFERLPASGFGLTAIGNDEEVIYTRQDDRTYKASKLGMGEDGVINTDLSSLLSILPEKCTSFRLNQNFICATDNKLKSPSTPDNWYTGEKVYSDDIWEVDPEEQSVNRLVRVVEESGREVDMMNLEVGHTNDNLYFQNKSDQTLWMFELPTRMRELNNSLEITDNSEDNI